MTSVSEFVLSYVVNACWQIAVITGVAAAGEFVLRNAPARYRHLLWFAALALCVIVPLFNVTRSPRVDKSVLKSFEGVASTISAPVSAEPENPVFYLTRRRARVVNASTSTTTWLILAYALFIAWRMIRFVRFWVRKERLRRSTVNTDLPHNVEQVAQRCRTILALPHVRIARSSTVRVPYTLGACRPLIVIPEAFCSADDEQLISVIGHELAHVARRDYVTNFLRELVALPISFHPLTFFINRQIDRARELACDELVSKRLLPPKRYARSLVWAADLSSQARSQALLLSMFDSSSLEERIMRLTRNRKLLSLPLARVLTSTALCLLCATAISLSLFSFELRTQAHAVFTTATPQIDNVNTLDANTPGTSATVVSANTPRISTDVAETSAAPQARTETRAGTPDAQQRAQAACDAGRNRDTERIPALIDMLGDDTRTELIRCWTNGRWSPALDTFKHPSPGEQAAIALASMGRVAFLPLQNQLDSTNATVRRNAAWAIGELTNMPPGERDGAVPRLISLLTDPDGWVRMASARALGELRHPSAVPALVANLVDTDVRVREFAIWALSELKDKSAVRALCQVLLSDLSAEARRGAAEALGEIRDAEALPFLKQVLDDPAVRAKAQWAISEIEGE
jgi:beta-lactamase regulating signal transducer with metallopeptidase domain/HEAT repeat protein